MPAETDPPLISPPAATETVAPAAATGWPRRFQDRVILVTGASGGLGTAICERLATEGACVIGADIVPPAGDRIHHALKLDVTDQEGWTEAVRFAREEFDQLDGLVMCQGILGAEVSVPELDPADWRRVLEVNLTGAFLGLAACIPPMVERGYGRIVALASIAAKEGNAHQAAYSASKAGLVALVKAAAKECATSGVTVNSIAPSMIATHIIDGMSEALVATLLAKVPMGRLGTAEELAALAAWLLSEEASYTTAQCLDLSGGRAVY